MFPSCRPSQSLWWHADELIHSKKSLRICAFPKLIVHGLLSMEEHLFPSFGAGDTRNTVWETLHWGHRLCPTSFHSCLQVTPSACPTFSQVPSSCHSSQKDRVHRLHSPFICWISIFCHACRKPKQLDLGARRKSRTAELCYQSIPCVYQEWALLTGKKKQFVIDLSW